MSTTVLKFSIVAPAAALLLAGCMTTTESVSMSDTRALTAAEFTASHVGNCTAYTGETTGTECFNADGTASYDDATYGTDTGTWRLNGDELCVTWSQEGTEGCATIMTDGQGRYMNEGYTWTVTA